MQPGDLVRIKGKGRFAKEAVAIGILVEFDTVEPDGGWVEEQDLLGKKNSDT